MRINETRKRSLFIIGIIVFIAGLITELVLMAFSGLGVLMIWSVVRKGG